MYASTIVVKLVEVLTLKIWRKSVGVLQDFLGDVPQVLLPINTNYYRHKHGLFLKFGVRIPFYFLPISLMNE